MTTGPPTPMAPATESGQALSRFTRQAAAQGNQAAVNLALLEAENTQAAASGTGRTRVQGQGAHPSMQRLATPQWAGMTGQLNNAQRAQASSQPAWVTVPADKVVVTPTGAQGIAPMYATPNGYRSRPGESAGSIPPPIAAGRP